MSKTGAVLAIALGLVACGQPQAQRRTPEQAALLAMLGEAFEFRTIDGTGNNLGAPLLGSANTALMRMTSPAYEDGAHQPSGSQRASARQLSNALSAQSGSLPNSLGASDYLWAWGQFIDHDLDLTEGAQPAEDFSIPVPPGDPQFDPSGAGNVSIPMARSHYATLNGMRHQMNGITSFLDASNVYGSDAERSSALRTLDGTGRLKVSAGNLLPFNHEGLPNAALPNTDPETLFLAGDVRANEVVPLTSLHTVFVREHNRLAEEIRILVPELTGDEVFELARRIVGAELQAITYREFLPVLLGPDALPSYAGYNPELDPSVANFFSTAAYRIGHSMVSNVLLRVDASGQPIGEGALPLRDAFFAPEHVQNHGIEPVLRGLAAQPAQELDLQVVDNLRNFLFGNPGQGGFDLAAFNIQRGRDHGLCGYNQARRDMGLEAAKNFAEVTSDLGTLIALASNYPSLEEIDVWVGGLAEDRVPGSMLGELFHTTLVDQFVRLRDGDRFWYEAVLPPDTLEYVHNMTLAEVIRQNTTIDNELPDDVFGGSCLHATHNGAGLPIDIPTTDGLAIEIDVETSGRPLSFSVHVDHPQPSGLVIYLLSPTLALSYVVDGTVATDGSLIVDGLALGSLSAHEPPGVWTLFVSDNSGQGGGQLVSASLTAECEL